VKVWAIISIVEADGWRLTTTKGSHRQFKHPTKAGRVTIADKLREDMHPKTEAGLAR
jgi:predicted RNA binding protein YcfA (HicA-like mRNA interferase family)